MRLTKLIRATALSGAAVFVMAATARASPIVFSTNAPGTGFGGTNLTLNNSSGQAATLAFVPDANISTGVPSNINFGNFTLACATCGAQATGLGAIFSGFTFDLVLTDMTDGASGTFIGTSTGGAVFTDQSTITINWSPSQIGPGTTNVTSGNFQLTSFVITSQTRIVNPDSGAQIGSTTVQGSITGASGATPEPATLGLVGFALVGLGLLGRKRSLG